MGGTGFGGLGAAPGAARRGAPSGAEVDARAAAPPRRTARRGLAGWPREHLGGGGRDRAHTPIDVVVNGSGQLLHLLAVELPSGCDSDAVPENGGQLGCLHARRARRR